MEMRNTPLGDVPAWTSAAVLRRRPSQLSEHEGREQDEQRLDAPHNQRVVLLQILGRDEERRFVRHVEKPCVGQPLKGQQRLTGSSTRDTGGRSRTHPRRLWAVRCRRVSVLSTGWPVSTAEAWQCGGIERLSSGGCRRRKVFSALVVGKHYNFAFQVQVHVAGPSERFSSSLRPLFVRVSRLVSGQRLVHGPPFTLGFLRETVLRLGLDATTTREPLRLSRVASDHEESLRRCNLPEGIRQRKKARAMGGPTIGMRVRSVSATLQAVVVVGRCRRRRQRRSVDERTWSSAATSYGNSLTANLATTRVSLCAHQHRALPGVL
uniref:Uncharacterized protein n=1 Tax=Mycena chlorophos TaxID=658473 RepID=A0ABQ0LAQ3_MYCCL|nr:predicted protein [Mycena chlorophos]